MKLYPERLNHRYDRLTEPRRFFVALLLISPLFFASSLPLLVQAAIMFWGGMLGFCRAAYLCKLEFIPRSRGHQ